MRYRTVSPRPPRRRSRLAFGSSLGDLGCARPPREHAPHHSTTRPRRCATRGICLRQVLPLESRLGQALSAGTAEEGEEGRAQASAVLSRIRASLTPLIWLLAVGGRVDRVKGQHCLAFSDSTATSRSESQTRVSACGRRGVRLSVRTRGEVPPPDTRRTARCESNLRSGMQMSVRCVREGVPTEQVCGAVIYTVVGKSFDGGGFAALRRLSFRAIHREKYLQS